MAAGRPVAVIVCPGVRGYQAVLDSVPGALISSARTDIPLARRKGPAMSVLHLHPGRLARRALPLALLAAVACGRAGRPAFDQAIDGLFAAGYPQALESYFCSLGTDPELGFR